jgi:hydrogenase maturation factor
MLVAGGQRVNKRTFCSCSTCRSEAIEMRIVTVVECDRLALCETAGGRRRKVDVALVEHPTAGEVILVHADVAIARADDRTMAA